MKSETLKICGLLGILTLLSGCSSKVTSWTAPQHVDRPVGKTMILGVGKTVEISHYYESVFVNRLAKLGIEADLMHNHINREEMVTEDEIVEILKAGQFDSIIVTRVLSEVEHKHVLGADPYPDYYWHYYGFYSHSFHREALGNITEYQLESNLYDVSTRGLVWTGRKIIFDDRDEEVNVADVISSITKDLKKQGMLN